jgi:signal peptidase I
MQPSAEKSMNEGAYVTSRPDPVGMPGIEFAGLMEAVLEKNVPFRFRATGSSMTPFILDGDVVTMEPVSERLRPGHVVVFVNFRCNKLMVHRILRASPSGYVIRGDNNSEPDGLMPASSIVGRVVRVERRGRRVRLGLGIEGVVIACLSRFGWLSPLLSMTRGIIKGQVGPIHRQ